MNAELHLVPAPSDYAQQLHIATQERDREMRARIEAEVRCLALTDELRELRNQFQNVCAQLHALEDVDV
ncbi:MAG: hypothetical protein WBR15_02945 [Gammaproteobacteria bacterium]